MFPLITSLTFVFPDKRRALVLSLIINEMQGIASAVDYDHVYDLQHGETSLLPCVNGKKLINV